jgi:hypothetical protein
LIEFVHLNWNIANDAQDFYSAHLLDYCYGQYTPDEIANETLSLSDIDKNVTGCSNTTAGFWFNPEEILQKALDKTPLDVTLNDLNWPDDIQTGLDALRIVSVAAFVLYCIGIGLIFIALVAALVSIIADGRFTVCVNIMVVILAFLAIGLASALVTAVIVKGTDIINQYGKDIGIEAHRGGKFLALTWATTALVFITLIVWSVEVCAGRRQRQAYVSAKYG